MNNQLYAFLVMIVLCSQVIAADDFISDAGNHSVISTTNSPTMNNDRLEALLKKIDENTNGRKGFWSLTIENIPVQVITDERANRMRIIAPIVSTENLSKKELYRIMQANFDTALDARYAIANSMLWSTYIHPLGELNDETFLIALGQTVNIVITYGSSYSSGLLSFQGGDSQGIARKKLIDELRRKGLKRL